MSRPSLLEKAKDLRSHIIKAIIQQQDKELLKEIMEDSNEEEDDDDEENSEQDHSSAESATENSETKKKSTRTAVLLVEAVKSKQNPGEEQDSVKNKIQKKRNNKNRAPKWIVGYNDNSPKNNHNNNNNGVVASSCCCCATCDLVVQIHRVLDHSHLLAIPQICLQTLSNLIDFVNLERRNINTTQGNDESSGNEDHKNLESENNTAAEKSSLVFVTSSPRCENHEKILSSISTFTSSGKKFIEELLDHHLAKVCASLWASIWRKHVEVTTLPQMNEKPQQQQNNNNNDHGKSTKNNIGIELGSKQFSTSPTTATSPFTLFAPETDLLVQITKYLSSLVIPSSFNLQKKISVDFTKSKLFQPLFSFVESVEILKSRKGQNGNNQNVHDRGENYFFNLNCWLYQLCINIEEAIVVSSFSSSLTSSSSLQNQLSYSASILRIIEKKFMQDFVHGNFFSTSLNSQYSKLLDSNSKFWGSYVKTVVAASNGNTTNSYSNAEIENDFILVSHPFVWFIQEMNNKNSKSIIHDSNNGNNFVQQEVHSRYLLSTLLWFRSWLLVSPVNKFGMPQKFGDSVWFMYHLRKLFSSQSMSTMRIIDEVCFDILSIVMLQCLPIKMIEQEFLKNNADDQVESPKKDGNRNIICEIMIQFDSSCSTSAADNQPFHFGLESSTFVIHLQKITQFLTSEVLPVEHFWSRSCGQNQKQLGVLREIHFQESNLGDDHCQIHHDYILLIPSLSWIQNETSSLTSMPSPSIGFVNKKFVNFVMETDKRKLSIFDLVVFTRFEYFENTYPMPNDEEKNSAENLFAKRRIAE